MKFSQPTPALPVPDVRQAQAYYRDHLGFKIEWYNEDGRIGGVSHGDCAIFFREVDGPSDPAVFWVFAEDVNAAYAEFIDLGADIEGPPADMPWGLRQFTLKDPYGNQFHFHCDL